MTISHLMAHMKFNAKGHDAVSAQGVIPKLPALFDPTGVAVSIDVGGAIVSFMLDSHGRGKAANGMFALTLKPTKRNPKTKKLDFLGGDVKFKANLRNGNWSGAWSNDGVDPARTAKNQPLTLTVNLTFLNQPYTATVTAMYTGVAGKSGRFSK